MAPGLPPLPELALALLVAALGALVQSACGFGFGLVATPLLLLVDPRFVPAPLLVSIGCLGLLMMQRDAGRRDFVQLGWAFLGVLPGSALGANVLGVVAGPTLELLIASLVLLAVLMSVWGFRVEPTRPKVVLAGAAAGLMATVSSIAGPPLALLYQRQSGRTLRGVMSGFFVGSSLLSLGALALAGRIERHHLNLSAVLIPAVLVGYGLSGRLARGLDRGYTRRAVLALSTAASLILFLRLLDG